jgi:hypothetical protein
MNSYFSQVAPYMQPINPQEQQGLMPVFQNMAAQQANQNAALQQGVNLTNQAGMTTEGKQAGVGMNPMAMAMALRNKKPNYDQYKTSGDMTYFGSNSSGLGAGQGYSGMNAELGLGG